jgi:hypothetical protein
MPTAPTQISAFVSSETKEQIERYTRSTGVKKNHLVEEALRHHLLALRELPADIIVHPRIVVSGASAKELVKQLTRRPKPTAKLQALLARDDD